LEALGVSLFGGLLAELALHAIDLGAGVRISALAGGLVTDTAVRATYV